MGLTNDEAEHPLGPPVLWRSGSFVTPRDPYPRDRGSRFVERSLTFVQTLPIQGRAIIDILTAGTIHMRRGNNPRHLPRYGLNVYL